MGIQDRDYMRSDYSPKSREIRIPKKNRALLWSLAGGFVVLITLTAIFVHYNSSRQADTTSRQVDTGESNPDENYLTVEFPVNINSASKKDLMAVPHIGFTIATRIVDDRPYDTVDDLTRIRGIGDYNLSRMQEYLTVESEPVENLAAD